MSRRGQEFLYPARSSRLGLRWSEKARSTLAGATAAHPDFVDMSVIRQQSESAAFETAFDTPETALLLTEPASFGVPRGIAAWRQPLGGGTLRARGGHLAFVSGRPYRWQHTALRHNVGVILSQLFGVPETPTVVPVPPTYATRLHAPVPNPFNPQVRLHYELATPMHVRLRIYEPRVRLVRTLLDIVRPAGPGEVLWDGIDDRGHPAASGIYVVRLESQGTIHTSKVTLLR